MTVEYDNTRTGRASLRQKRTVALADGTRRPFSTMTVGDVERIQALRRLVGSDENTIRLIECIWPSTINPPPDHVIRRHCDPVNQGTAEINPKVLETVRNDLKMAPLLDHKEAYDQTFIVWKDLMQKIQDGESVDYKLLGALANGVEALGNRVLMEEYGPRKDEGQKWSVGNVNIISSRNPQRKTKGKIVDSPEVKVLAAG